MDRPKRRQAQRQIKAVLHGRGDQKPVERRRSLVLADSIKILALSGLRAGELSNLTVERCKGGVFQVIDAKSEAGKTTEAAAMMIATTRSAKADANDPAKCRAAKAAAERAGQQIVFLNY